MNTTYTENFWQGLSGALTITLAIALFGVPSLAYSQVLEEIIVTAQKREQNLQDVGISVTAFTANQIREMGFVNTTDVAVMTPGLGFTVPNAESSVIAKRSTRLGWLSCGTCRIPGIMSRPVRKPGNFLPRLKDQHLQQY